MIPIAKPLLGEEEKKAVCEVIDSGIIASGPKTKEFEEIKTSPTKNVDELESNLIREHIGQVKIEGMLPDKEEQLTHQLIKTLSTEKQEGERVIDFENRVKEEVNKILET